MLNKNVSYKVECRIFKQTNKTKYMYEQRKNKKINTQVCSWWYYMCPYFPKKL